MPHRQEILACDQIYHVFNRGIAGLPIFKSLYDYRRFLELIDYYRFENPPIRYSHYNRLPPDLKVNTLKNLHECANLVDIYSFTLIPNHYHFQLKQLSENGISKFLSNLQNAYARFFNTKYDESGTLFQLRFKAVRIENDEQCLHVNRYIHLNPLTSYLLKDQNELITYPWSSFGTYMGITDYAFVNTEFILKMFSGKRDLFQKFTFDQIDYQRKLAEAKFLAIE